MKVRSWGTCRAVHLSFFYDSTFYTIVLFSDQSLFVISISFLRMFSDRFWILIPEISEMWPSVFISLDLHLKPLSSGKIKKEKSKQAPMSLLGLGSSILCLMNHWCVCHLSRASEQETSNLSSRPLRRTKMPGATSKCWHPKGMPKPSTDPPYAA